MAQSSARTFHVNGVDLRIRRGAIHALIGPNGAGKTTVFNLLTRFLPATSGSVIYQGEDITHLRPAAVARRGLVRSFQISAVFPKLTVLENVRVALQRRVGGPDQARVRVPARRPVPRHGQLGHDATLTRGFPDQPSKCRDTWPLSLALGQESIEGPGHRLTGLIANPQNHRA